MTQDVKDDAAPVPPADTAVTTEQEAPAAAGSRTAAAGQAAADNELDDGEIQEVLDATVGVGTAAPALRQPEVKGDYDPGRYQDATRSYIAYWLLGLLTILVIGGFSLLFVVPGGATFDNLKSILELVFGPIIALVSAATGFYFGAQQPGPEKK
ncbi:hypothetical protein [Massilia sp. YMA4]|uniref:hypothetical protein n=1 Tax=Massilia sp. YMA4 TaxID=1593482 RepID=UPI000DD14249|nr:hypothetical protein [Massilia sp. YMA4]AXA89815.1 hypothetical protein DPH57_00665 [Massilia sp. YMA4]